MQRVTVEWTQTARTALAQLPLKVRRGLLDKTEELRKADDPTTVYKPLTGPLQGYYRISYSRYRAIYSVARETLGGGEVAIHIIIRFVAVGIRKEGDKKDIYRFVQKLLKLGVIQPVRPPRSKKRKS